MLFSDHKEVKGTLPRWDNIVLKNKKGVETSYKELIVQCSKKSKDGLKLLGSAIVVHRPSGKTGFFRYSGCFDVKVTEKAIQEFRITGKHSTGNKFLNGINNLTFRSIPMIEQAALVNSIPNTLVNPKSSKPSYARYTSLGVYKTEKDYPDYRPGFCRDFILYLSRDFADNAEREMCATFRKAFNMKPRATDSGIEIIKKNFKRPGDPLSSTPPAKKPRLYRGVTRLGEEDLRDAIDAMIETEQPKEPSLESVDPFDQYVTQLIETGHFSFRIHNQDTDSFCMNDIDMDNEGRFQTNQFVHTYKDRNLQGDSYSCTCQQYTTLLQIASFAVHEDDIPDVEELVCVHIRFIQEYVDKFSYDESNVMELIQQGMKYKNVGAVLLSSSSHKSKRYSIINRQHNKCSIVSHCGKYMKCHDGKCAAEHGNLRELESITSHGACEHLNIMHSFAEEFSFFTVSESEEDLDTELQDELEDHELISDSIEAPPDLPSDTRKVGYHRLLYMLTI